MYTFNRLKDTSQSNRRPAAFRSLIWSFSVLFPESRIKSSSDRLFKKFTVSERPITSPWRISKSFGCLLEICETGKTFSSLERKINEEHEREFTHEGERKLSLITAVGDPVRSPSSFSAFAYQSGMLRSLPGILCNW